MNLLRSLYLVVVLAVVSMVGIVTMLLSTGDGDVFAFVLAALPLVVGVIAARHQRNRRANGR